MANVFKCLDLEYRKSCVELSREEVNSTNYYVCKRRQETLCTVLGVLKSYSWVKREEVKKKVEFFIDNDFSYSSLADEFGITKKSAYVMISRAGKQFEDAVGISVGELIECDFCIENIKIKDDNISGIFIRDVQEQLQAIESVEIDLLECMSELTNLKMLTKDSINNRLKKLDVDKIAHLLFILQSSRTEYALEKELLKSYIINGSIKSKDELGIRLKDLYNVL